MQINSGIAYFGDEKIQGTLKEKVQNAIDSDVPSIQIKNTDIKNVEDLSGYNGSIACYLDDIKWDDDYFNNLNIKMKRLKELGLNLVVVPTMIDANEYKAMSHDDKLNTFRKMSKYILELASNDINVGLLNDNNGIYVGNVILPIVDNLNVDISNRVGYAVTITEKSDGGISKIGDVNMINCLNIVPITNKDGKLIYDMSRAFIGNVYYEFVKFGHVPNTFIEPIDMPLADVNNMSFLIGDIENIVNGSIAKANARTRVAPNYHPTGVSDNAGNIKTGKKPNLGFVDCMQLFLVLSTLCLIGVMIAIILVLL